MQAWLKLNHIFRRKCVEMVDLYSLYRMVTLKIMPRSAKSNQLFPPFQQCIYPSTGSEYSTRKTLFYSGYFKVI